MAVPSITGVSPARGQSRGGQLARLTGEDFSEQVTVRFGDADAEVLFVRTDAGGAFADVRTPAHEPGLSDVRIINLDADGVPVPGEESVLAEGYRFDRYEIVRESDLTRLVRTLLQKLKAYLLANTSISVSVDYDDTVEDGLDIVAMAELPSLVLSGPRLAENRFYSMNTSREAVVDGPTGPEVIRHRPPYTADLTFTITVASDRTFELFNLMAAMATFLHQSRWLEMARDAEHPGAGSVRWEMDPDGDFRTRLDGADDVRAFTCGLVIRGVDVADGLPLDIGLPVEVIDFLTETLENGETP